MVPFLGRLRPSKRLTIYGHGGHLSRVIRTIWTNFRFPIPRRLQSAQWFQRRRCLKMLTHDIRQRQAYTISLWLRWAKKTTLILVMVYLPLEKYCVFDFNSVTFGKYLCKFHRIVTHWLCSNKNHILFWLTSCQQSDGAKCVLLPSIMGVIPMSLPVLSTELVLHKVAVDREIWYPTEQYGCRQRI